MRIFLWSSRYLFLVLVSIPLTGVLSVSCRDREPRAQELLDWGLPTDLYEKQNQLKYLSLPPKVRRLDWLSDHIEGLSVAGTAVKSLEGLPGSLRELDISSTSIGSLDFIPAGLRVLDLRKTPNIKNLLGLPPGLESLKVSGAAIKRLGSLPRSLKELHLENTEVRDLADLPPELEVLHLQGDSFENLSGLPEKLRSLTLHSTRVGSLADLPSSLQTLTLVNNNHLTFTPEELPPLLSQLIIDDQAAPNLAGLRYLHWLSDRRENPQGPYPNFLSFLTLRATNLQKSEALPLPKSLRALGWLHSRVNLPANLPAEIEVLDLTGYRLPDLKLPLKRSADLKKLKLARSSIKNLPELPAGLEELDLSGTDIKSLVGIPSDLEVLIFRDARISRIESLDQFKSMRILDLCNSVELSELGPIPKTLTYLDLSGARIRRLPGVSDSLRELDISNTQIKSLDGLKEAKNLTSLTLSEDQVTSLGEIPDKLRLRFVAKPKEAAEDENVPTSR